MSERSLNALQWSLLGSSMVALFLWSRGSIPPSPPIMDMVSGSLMIAFLSLVPLPMGQSLINLSHLISLSLFLTHGPFISGISLITGMGLAWVTESVLKRRAQLEPGNHIFCPEAWAFTLSRQTFSLLLGAVAYVNLGGCIFTAPLCTPSSLSTIVFTLTFGVVYLLFHWLEHAVRVFERPNRRSFSLLAIAALIPTPFAILGATTYVSFGPLSIIFVGAITTVLALSVRSLIITERDLNRRLQELSIVNRISDDMQRDLNLDQLLQTIYEQVADLLDVNNFYIALVDERAKTLSYPMAIKGGERQNWPSRPVMDRLTDRVINSATPILIPREAPKTLKEMGLPELSNAPEAWLGVPLLQPEHALGCLAIFHTQQGKAFSPKDQVLLETIAGQASAVIENALLFEETRSRAQALSSLNEITTSMSSTLDPERTLEMVCRSVIHVCGGEQAAIFLNEPDRSQLLLARATDLHDSYINEWQILSGEGNPRAAAFYDERILLVSHLEESNLSEAHLNLLREQGIQAYADLPLITPSGPLGQLSIYFTSPQLFPPNQIELMETFAAQAALSVANARAHAETDQALRRRVEQLGMLEAIGREMAATLDTNTLVDVVLAHGLRMAGAERGHLVIYREEDKVFKVSAQAGYPAHVTLPRQYSLLDDAVGNAFRTRQAVRVVASDLEDIHSPWLQASTRCLLCIPLVGQDRAFGVLVVENHPSGTFSDEHERFLTQLAAQAAVAISNAALYQQIEARLREQSLLYQASAQIAASLDLEAVTLATVDSLAVALDLDGVILSKWNPESHTLHAQAAVINGKPGIPREDLTINSDAVPALGLALNVRKPIQWTISSAETEQDRAFLEEVRQSRSILLIPLIAGEVTLGVLEALSKHPRAFDENTLRIAQTIASQAAISMENTDLFQRVCESNDRILAVLNSTFEGILMMDIAGKVLLANPQITEMIGIPSKELLSLDITDADSPLPGLLGYQRPDFVNMLTILKQGKAVQGERFTFDRDGRNYLRIDTPVQDAAGQVIGWLVVLRDVSEEQKLQAAREHLTEMIVHDLRSPLTSILGSLVLLEKVKPEKGIPVFEQAINVSRNSVEQMLGLVNSLLDIAKLESGDLPLETSRFKLTKLLHDVIDMHIPEANQVGVILHHRIPENFPYVTGDRDKLRRVFSNLVDNALKFTPGGGQITVDLERVGKDAHLVVTDTGPGIPEEYRERIFERFSQVPGTVSRRHGTGLGLAFAKLTLTAHHGTIWVDEPEGGGSAFHIRFPISYEVNPT